MRGQEEEGKKGEGKEWEDQPSRVITTATESVLKLNCGGSNLFF